MEKLLKVDPTSVEPSLIDEAVEVLKNAGLVVIPTETVYGIAANLLRCEAMERLRQIKQRDRQKPFTIHIANSEDVQRHAVNVGPWAYRLMDLFWPGPLTLVLEAPEQKTVGLRVPNCQVTLKLLEAADFPVVVPSANRPGSPESMDAQEAFRELGDLVDLVIDAGPVNLGVSSTVVDARRLPVKILREGYISGDEIQKAASLKNVLFVCTGNSCRSVMAEFLLKKKMQVLGRQDIEASSCGTFAFWGMAPTRETQRLVQGIGLDASGHHARRVDLALLKRADLILVMERHHKEEINRQFPQVASRVHLLGDYVKLEPEAVQISDPIGHSEEFYWECFQKIKKAVERLGEIL